jgi:hypothetical protein
MKQTTRVTAVIVMVLALQAGCSEGPAVSAVTEALHYSDPSEQLRLQEALQNANIPFEIRRGVEGREEIWYESRFKTEVARIQGEVFGVPPPMGRSISLGAEAEGNAAFIEELRKRNASFSTAKYQDLEFVVWPPESDELADAALEAISVSPEQLRVMKEMRQAADAEQRDRTTRSSRAREERVPAER